MADASKICCIVGVVLDGVALLFLAMAFGLLVKWSVTTPSPHLQIEKDKALLLF